jgi:hypothetical protein
VKKAEDQSLRTLCTQNENMIVKFRFFSITNQMLFL